MEEDRKQENNAQDTVDIAQALDFALMVLLLGEIEKTLREPKNKDESINNIRKGIKLSVNKYLPLMIASANKVLKNNYSQITNDLKGNIPKYIANNDVEDYFKKYIKTKGTNFVIGKQGIPQFFTNFIEQEVKSVVDGTATVEDAIKKAISNLAKNEIKIIDYDSGVTRNIDVWCRQQMLYAQKQSTQDIRERYAKENDITIFEFDAHPNARPTHQVWQGKRYDTTGKYYPTLNELTHGEHNDYNCKHRAFPVYDKDNKYMFTKEQLDNINTKPFQWKGKEVDGYEGTQLMRRYEREIRAIKREMNLNDRYNIDNTKLKAKASKKRQEYKELCKKMGTYQRTNRLTVNY